MILTLVISATCLSVLLAVVLIRIRQLGRSEHQQSQNTRIAAAVAEKTHPMIRDLEQARTENRRLSVANVAQGGYLAGLNLALRRPLGDLTSLAEGLLCDAQAFGLTPDQQDRIRGIVERSAGMMGVLDRVGALTELSGKGFHVRPERLDPRWVAHDAFAAMKTQADAKSLTLKLAERAANPPVNADPQRLRQLLVNLLAYAIHDSAPESEIRLSVNGGPSGVVLTLSAPGVVLSDRQIHQLFDLPSPEFLSDFDLVGASISRGVAEAMDGTLVATREPSGGLQIDLTLPTAEAAPASEDEAEVDGGGGTHLLLITSNPAAAAALRRGVQPLGAQLFVAAPEDDPVGFARDLRPDAILIDADPMSEALQLKAVLDASPLARGIPVIGLAARHTPCEERQALNAGFAAWMPWPVQTGALRRITTAVVELSLHRKAA